MQQGEQPTTVKVVIAGVPVDGTVDMGADITIVGAQVFKRLTAVKKLRRCNFKPSDRRPRPEDVPAGWSNRLGCYISGTDYVYVKMDVRE